MSPESPEYTPRVNNSTPTEGLGVVDDIYRGAMSLKEGDFGAIQTMIQSARSGMVRLKADPIDFFSQLAIGFILEHVEPLKKMLNDFTGDSGAVLGMSASWNSIASSLVSTADEVESTTNNAMSNMYGEAAQRYVQRQQLVAAAMRAVAESSTAFGSALSQAADVVDAIHDMVRDAIADVLATCISAVAWSFATLGVAAPAKGAEVSAKVATWVSYIAQIGQALIQLLKAIKSVFDSFKSIESGLTDHVKQIGANCTMPAGGCCGAHDMSAPLTQNGSAGNATANGQTGGSVSSGNSSVNVGGNNYGTINQDNSTHNGPNVTVNPSVTVSGGGTSSGKGGKDDSSSKGGTKTKTGKGSDGSNRTSGNTGSGSSGKSGKSGTQTKTGGGTKATPSVPKTSKPGGGGSAPRVPKPSVPKVRPPKLGRLR